ncbi:MAG: agmatinase [Patescibacteria group bacterium]|nr:agmatinase [Patescibacteria group bacterium]
MPSKINFGAWPKENFKPENAKVVILPVPYDGTSTWIKGADKGPQALFEASTKLELYDIETDAEVYRQGIMTAPAVKQKGAPEKMIAAVRQAVSGFLQSDKFVVTVGGEHSVTIGAVQAYKEKYPGLSVLQLDAHADLQPEYYGSKYNHGCVMARLREFCPIVQAGIRSMSAEEKPFLDKSRVYFAHDIHKQTAWQRQAAAKLTDQVYVTIDLDVFDPSVLPSTGTPEPGGLGWYQVLDFLKIVSQEKQIVGFDVVELCPNPAAKASDFLAAKLVYKFLSYIFVK